MSEVENVTLRIDGDGDQLVVRISALGGDPSADFCLPSDAWRDLYGVPLEERGSAGPGAGPTRSAGARRYRPLIPAEHQVRKSPQELGADLFRALFPGEIHALYSRARGRAGRLRLRLQLDLSDPRTRRLHRLPWELLCDPLESDFLLLDRGLTLIRHCLRPKAARPAAAASRLRVLPVASNPRGSVRLDLGEEEDGLRRALVGEPLLEVLPRPERAELMKVCRLLEGGVEILHFMGHGDIGEDGQGRLLFETSSGEPDPVHAEDLASKLGRLDGLRLVVLNACRGAEIRSEPYSGVATALVRQGIPAVIAMQSPISDDGAIAFSSELYRHLARGEALDLALGEARHALYLKDKGSPEWATPVLFAAGTEPLVVPAAEEQVGAGVGKVPDEGELKRRYLSYLAEELDGVETPWLPPSSPLRRFRLQAVYSKLRSSLRSGRDRGSRRAADEAAEMKRFGETGPRWSSGEEGGEAHSWPRILGQEERVVVVGESGSGKTHFLRYTALAWALTPSPAGDAGHAEGEPNLLRDLNASSSGVFPLPILVHARRFAGALRRRSGLRFSEYLGRHLGPDLETPVADVGGRSLEPSSLHQLLFRELLRGGACLLIEGFDDIEDRSERWQIAEEIQAFLRFAFSSPTGEGPGRGCRAILSCRPGSELLEVIDERMRVFELQPLDEEGLSKFCDDLEHATGSTYLRAQLQVLEGLGHQRRSFWPAEVVLFCHFLSPFGGRLPKRLAELAESLLEFLHEEWEVPAEKRPSRYDPCWEWRRLLPELAAAALDEAPWGQVEAGWVLRWLGERFSGTPASELRQAFFRKLGPLVSIRNDFRILQRLLQDLLGALWLASDPGQARERLQARCGQPRWRRPAAVGLGLLSKMLSGEELESLVSEVAGDEEAAAVPSPGRDLPARLFLLVQALDELERPPPPAVELIVRRLLREASGPIPPLRQACRRMLLARVHGAHGSLVLRAVERALDADASLATAVAGFAAEAQLSPRTVEILESCRDRDQPPWPIEQALRQVAEADPVLLSAPRFSLRRAVARDPALARQLNAGTSWRRLMLVLFGGRPESPTLFPPDPQLEWELVQAAEKGRAPGEVLAKLQGPEELSSPCYPTSLHPYRGLAMRALAIAKDTGGPGSPGDLAPWSLALSRALAGLPEEVRAEEGILEGLRRVAHALAPRLWRAAFDAALPRIAREDRLNLLLHLAERLSPDRRAPVLGGLFRELSANVLEANAEGEAEHRLAVLLDTRGALLTEPAAVLINACLAWTDSRVPAPLPLEGSDLVPERLAAALDSLLALPDFLAPIQALALRELAPRLTVAGFGVEGEIAAELALPERFGLRSLVREAFGAGPAGASLAELLARAEAIADPWRRFRALRRLALHRFSERRTLGTPRWGGGRGVLAPLEAAAYSITAPYVRSLAFEALASDAPPGQRTAWALESAAAATEVSGGELRARLGLRQLALGLHPEPAGVCQQVRWEVETIGDCDVRADLLDRLRRLAPQGSAPSLAGEVTPWSSADLCSLAEGRHGELLLRHLGDAGAGGDLLAVRALTADLEGSSRGGREAPSGHSRLELAEAGELDLPTFEAVAELLDSSDDHLRLRAALALHGAGGERLSCRSAGTLDPEVLLAMARRWRRLRRESPRRAVILRWTFATFRHDSPELLADLGSEAARGGSRARDAETVLRLMEALDTGVIPEVVRILREGSARARRALVLGLATVLGRGRGLDLLWPPLSDALPAAADAFGDERISLEGPMALVEAAETAWRRLGRYGAAVACRAQELIDGRALAWGELLRQPPEKVLSSLTRIGRRRFFGEGSQAEVREAAERAVEQPELLPLLLDWIEQRWRRDLQALAAGDYQACDLLQLVARVAARLPATYFEATEGRPLWGRLLRDAAVDSDRFGARIAALELLGLRRRLDEGALEGLLAAVGDVPEVETSAFAVLDSFQALDDLSLMAPLEAALRGPSAARAYLAGQLLVRIAVQPGASSELAARADRALAEVGVGGGKDRHVYLATLDSRSFGRLLGIENRGRLGDLLYGLRLELHRVEEILRYPERRPTEGAP